MIVELLTQKDETVWDEYAIQTEGATISHLVGWKDLVTHVYGNRYRPVYLLAKNEDGFKGILPLFFSNNRFQGKKLFSVPFGISGGVCTHSDLARNLLLQKAIELCHDLKADYLELRNLKEAIGEFVTNFTYFTLVLELESDPDMLRKKFRKGINLGIKTAEKSNVTVDLMANDVKQFYRIYAKGQRNLGTPVQSYAWIKQLFDRFSEYHTIALARYKHTIIGVQFVRKFKETVSSVYAYTLPEYKDLCPNHILLWELIKDACKNGYRYFDFGRSLPESGTYFFKTGWRAQPVQLFYQYYLNKSNNVLDTSQSSHTRKKLAAIWKRIPLPIANQLGPVIRGYFP